MRGWGLGSGGCGGLEGGVKGVGCRRWWGWVWEYLGLGSFYRPVANTLAASFLKGN